MSEGGRVSTGVRREWTKDVLALSAYAAVVAFMTWPASTLLNRSYGQRGDAMGSIWWLWWQKFAAAQHVQVNPVSWISAPFGRTMSGYSRDLLSSGVLRVLSQVTDETVGYNLFLLASFFLAAASMYFLVRWLTGKRAPAFVSGLIFGFSPYMLMHGKEHITLLTTATIPLFFYFLIRALRERTAAMYGLSAVSFALMALFNYHYGLIGGVIAAVFLLSTWLFGRPWKRPKAVSTIVPVIAIIVLAGAAVLVGYMRGGFKAIDLRAVYLYSARPWDYFIPHVSATILGHATRGFIYSHLHGSFLSENSLFLGFGPLALAAYALFALPGRFRSDRVGQGSRYNDNGAAVGETRPVTGDPRIPYAVALSGAVCFIFSLPPSTTLFGMKVYLPSWLLHYFVPDVRAYSRFGIGVVFSVAVLAGYGIAVLLTNGWFSRNRKLLVSVIAVIVLLEFAIVPPFHSLATGKVTDYYQWLKERTASPVVAIYPEFYADDFQSYDYYMDQRHHEKKIVNGAEPFSRAEQFRQSILDITNPSTPGILKSLGVEYVLVIPSLYLEGRHVNYIEAIIFDRSAAIPGLEKVMEFKDGIIYRDVAEPAELVPLFTGDAGQPVVDSEGRVWHPYRETASVSITSVADGPVVADVSFSVKAVRGTGRFSSSLIGQSGTGRLSATPAECTLRSVTLEPGTSSVLRIEAEAGLGEVEEVPGATSTEARILISDIKVVRVAP